jgi:hypothetical protein
MAIEQRKQPKLRTLRIAFAVICGIACMLLLVLWVRSYQKCEIVSYVNPGNVVTTFGSNGGTVYYGHMTLPPNPLMVPGFPRQLGWRYGSDVVGEVPSMFEFRNGIIRLPYFRLVTITGLIGVAPWISWSKRFSLRTLLIATTLVALVLGLIFAVSR